MTVETPGEKETIIRTPQAYPAFPTPEYPGLLTTTARHSSASTHPVVAVSRRVIASIGSAAPKTNDDLPPVVVTSVPISREDSPSPPPHVTFTPSGAPQAIPTTRLSLTQSFLPVESQGAPPATTDVVITPLPYGPGPLQVSCTPKQPTEMPSGGHPLLTTGIAPMIVTLSPPARETTALENRMWSLLAYKTSELEKEQQFKYVAYWPNQRFSTILCLETGIIRVDDQIMHANVVSMKPFGGMKEFIASQAPVEADEGRFWQLAFENPNFHIVDLTNEEDKWKGSPRQSATEYYPTLPGASKTYSLSKDTRAITVTLKSSEFFGDGTKYTYDVTETQQSCGVAQGVTKSVVRYHFPIWPDKEALTLNAFKQLIAVIDTPKFTERKTLIHCRAGVGRTGTVITAIFLEELIEIGKIKDSPESPLEESIINLILQLRLQRGPAFVQTIDQFKLLVDYGKDLLAKKT